MRRVFTMLGTTALLLAAGCGGRTYETRLDNTLEIMKYNRQLDNNLMPPATKTKLEALNIYVRPPKPFTPSKEFLLTALEPGKFDDAESFSDKTAQLHVLARVERPKGPVKKGAKPPAVTPRGPFVADVIGVLNGVYNSEQAPAKAKSDNKRGNPYKRLAFEGNGKDVQVYFYGSKQQKMEVALIFEYPKAEAKTIARKIDLALESFATGEKARGKFAGGESDMGAGGEGGATPGAAPVSAF